MGLDHTQIVHEEVRQARATCIDWQERMAVSELEIEAALYASVPGGATASCWLPQADAWTPHQTARDVLRAVIATVDRYRENQRRAARELEARRLAPLPFQPGGMYEHASIVGVFGWEALQPGCSPSIGDFPSDDNPSIRDTPNGQ